MLIISIAAYWIGVTDTKTEGVWLWGTSQTVVTFTDFHKPPDNHRGNQDCVQLLKTEEYKWDDNFCVALRAFICKKSTFY